MPRNSSDHLNAIILKRFKCYRSLLGITHLAFFRQVSVTRLPELSMDKAEDPSVKSSEVKPLDKERTVRAGKRFLQSRNPRERVVLFHENPVPDCLRGDMLFPRERSS